MRRHDPNKFRCVVCGRTAGKRAKRRSLNPKALKAFAAIEGLPVPVIAALILGRLRRRPRQLYKGHINKNGDRSNGGR